MNCEYPFNCGDCAFYNWKEKCCTPNEIRGQDENGYFVKERVCIHTDGTPDEYVTTYYEPFEKEGEAE